MDDTFEQSNPPPVDAEQLNKFSDENTNQNDVQVMLDLLYSIWYEIAMSTKFAYYSFISSFSLMYCWSTSKSAIAYGKNKYYIPGIIILITEKLT